MHDLYRIKKAYKKLEKIRRCTAFLLSLTLLFCLTVSASADAEYPTAEDMTAAAEKYLDLYYSYACTGSEGSMWAVLVKTLNGTPLYNLIRQSQEGMIFCSRTVVSDMSIEISDTQAQSATDFSCSAHVSGHCTATRWKDAYEYDLDKNLSLTFHKSSGEWKAGSMDDLTPVEGKLADLKVPGVEIVEIADNNVRGRMLIVSDPQKVILGTMENIGKQEGLQLTELVSAASGVAGINGGGYNDDNGHGNGGIPVGLVIRDGEIIYGEPSKNYTVIGLDGNGKLWAERMTGNDAISRDIRWAVSFQLHTGASGALITDRVVQQNNIVAGINPRTAIGQRSDGAVLLLVLDGRSLNTLGASVQDVVDVMTEYGAVTAGNLDGGASSQMVIGDEIVSDVSSATGSRRIPTGFIVLP